MKKKFLNYKTTQRKWQTVKKITDHPEFEPATLALLVPCSTKLANESDGKEWSMTAINVLGWYSLKVNFSLWFILFYLKNWSNDNVFTLFILFINPRVPCEGWYHPLVIVFRLTKTLNSTIKWLQLLVVSFFSRWRC